MPRTIVWASDGSDNAERALQSAQALFADDGATIIAVHIVQEDDHRGARPAVDTRPRDVVPTLRAVLADLSQQGIDAVLRVVDQVSLHPAQAIADIAGEVGADVIVVGTRGLSPVGGVILGSVTQRLLHLAPCPVLAVPPVSHRVSEALSATRAPRAAPAPSA
jgi:nucleotide-binding universal stress UspA family protein